MTRLEEKFILISEMNHRSMYPTSNCSQDLHVIKINISVVRKQRRVYFDYNSETIFTWVISINTRKVIISSRSALVEKFPAFT